MKRPARAKRRPRRKISWRRPTRRQWIYAIPAILGLWIVFEVITAPSGAELKNNNPESTKLIDTRLREARSAGHQPIRLQQWRSLDRISPKLIHAVIIAEDARFYSHRGFDWKEIGSALRRSITEFRFPRGASTISQQVAKNLYLSESKNPLRKFREAIITTKLEGNLGKQRILELYLNIIEWGDGIYGAEAAAQHYFGKSAGELGERDAFFLAAIIPNPRAALNPRLHPQRVSRRSELLRRREGASNAPKTN